MSVTIEKQVGEGQRRSDDSLSLSSGSSFDDSGDELEKRAHAIRHDLRTAELIEIARVAERAAESGLDTFTALASTYNNDKDASVDMRPLPMKRNKTFSAGQRRMFRRPMMRQSSDTGIAAIRPGPLRRKRKIPVLALRHIDDLIPPVKQLHLHLRSHLYRVGVETEKSLLDKPVDLDAEVKVEAKAVQSHRSLKHQESLIKMMKSWVSVDNNEEKKEEDNYEVSKFDVGDRLCEQMVSPEVTSGQWSAGPVELPDGLVPPEEQHVVNVFSTPYRKRRPPPSPPKDQGDQSTCETAQLTEPTSASSEYGGEAKPNPSPLFPRTPLSPSPEITPVALFDAEEEEEGDKGSSENITLGSRDHPKPFEVMRYKQQYVEDFGTPTTFRSLAEPISPNQMPNLFITPVRLKGIRDKKSLQKRSLTWGFPRVDSFKSEPGTTPTNGYKSFADDDSYEVKMAKSESNLFMGSEGSSWLVPRSRSVTEMIGAIQGHEPTQAPGQSTRDLSDTSTSMRSNHNLKNGSLLHDSDSDSLRSQPLHEIPRPPLTDSLTDSAVLRWQNGGNTTPPRASSPVVDSPKATPTNQREESAQDSAKEFTTPCADHCECLSLVATAASVDSLSDDNEDEKQTKRKHEPESTTEPPVWELMTAPSLRRVMSCPSFADNWDDVDFGAVSRTAALEGANKSRTSLLSAFQRLTPHSGRADVGRTLYFNADDNSEYLNNFLYFGKPPEGCADRQLHPQLGPFCNDRPCLAAESSCAMLASFSDAASFLLEPHIQSKEQDLLTFETNEHATFTGETWFDAASEKFDSALERLVGSRNNKDWGNYFHAPTLNIKTPQSARKTRSVSVSDADPRLVQGIVLLRQDVPALPNDCDAPSDEEFSGLYGISRSEFRTMSKEQRLALWTERREHDQPTPTQTPPIKSTAHNSPYRKKKTKKHHRSVMSTSDIVTLLGTEQLNLRVDHGLVQEQ